MTIKAQITTEKIAYSDRHINKIKNYECRFKLYHEINKQSEFFYFELSTKNEYKLGLSDIEDGKYILKTHGIHFEHNEPISKELIKGIEVALNKSKGKSKSTITFDDRIIPVYYFANLSQAKLFLACLAETNLFPKRSTFLQQVNLESDLKSENKPAKLEDKSAKAETPKMTLEKVTEKKELPEMSQPKKPHPGMLWGPATTTTTVERKFKNRSKKKPTYKKPQTQAKGPNFFKPGLSIVREKNPSNEIHSTKGLRRSSEEQ